MTGGLVGLAIISMLMLCIALEDMKAERFAVLLGILPLALGTLFITLTTASVLGWGLLMAGLMGFFPTCHRWKLADTERLRLGLVNIAKGMLNGGGSL